MKKMSVLPVLLFILLSLLTLFSLLALPLFAEDAWYGDYRLSGPYTYRNLSIYLVHGGDTVDAGDYMTLEEALDSGALQIKETGSVNTLQVVNRSRRKIFIQSGDMIKGGKQDRVIKHDLIINTGSGSVNINVYCVEHGRWQQRGMEDVSHFSSSTQKVASKDIKLAAKAAESQQGVWDAVAESQKKLEKNTGAPVRSSQSESSMQLTLENRDVNRLAGEYVRAIENLVSGQRDVVGYAFAINGEINSADIYGNRTLFEKLWDKQIRASAIEAVSEKDSDSGSPAPRAASVAGWLGSADNAKQVEKSVDGYNVSVEQDSGSSYSYEAYEPAAAKPGYIHKSVIKK